MQSPQNDSQETPVPEELRSESDLERDERREDDRLKSLFQHIGIAKGMTLLQFDGQINQGTKVLSQMVGSKGRVIVALPSSTDVESSRRKVGRSKNISLLQTEFEKISLDSDAVDCSISYGLFKFLSQPQKVLSELIRVTKHGGKIAVAAPDSAHLVNFPMPAYLEKQLTELIEKIAAAGIWDPNRGRRLFTYFQEACLNDVKVHLGSYGLYYGDSNHVETREWTERLEKVGHLIEQGLIKLSFDLNAFRTELFMFFKNPVRFSYTPLILVEGTKPL